MQKRHQIPFIKDVHLNSPYLHWILYDVETCKNLESFGKCMQSFTTCVSIWGKVSTIVTSLSMTPFCHFFCSPLVQFPKKQTKKQGHSWDVASFQLRAFWEPPDCKKGMCYFSYIQLKKLEQTAYQTNKQKTFLWKWSGTRTRLKMSAKADNVQKKKSLENYYLRPFLKSGSLEI